MKDIRYGIRSLSDPREPAGLAFSDQLLARVASLPGVQAATVATVLPLGAGLEWGKFLSIADRPAPASIDQVPLVRFTLISDDYFRTFGIAVREGRAFDGNDKSNSQPPGSVCGCWRCLLCWVCRGGDRHLRRDGDGGCATHA